MDDSKYKKKIQHLAKSLENYDHISVLEAWLSNLISDKDQKDVDLFKRLPWIQFFLLKLALLGKSGPIKMSRDRFTRYANQLYSMQIDAAHGLEPDKVELLLRPMIVQQIWYQQKHDDILIALFRQRVFFLSANPWYAEQFHKNTGVTLDNFYVITIYLLTSSRDHKLTALDINLYDLLFHLAPRISFEEVIRYFLLMGVRTVDISNYINHHRLYDIYESEYFQDTPLKGRPIIINGESLIIPDLHMFNAAIKDFVPDYLKNIPGYKDQFGPDFELYLQDVLLESKLEFWDEKNKITDIYRKYGIKGKVVDFLIPGKDSVVLVESKAIEPNAVVKTSSDADQLKRMLSGSYIKAIKQGMHAASALGQTPEFSGKKFSLLVVTHEDFGIFGGRWVTQYIDKDIPEWITSKYPNSPLSIDDIFYCTVDDFETLTRAHSNGVCDLFSVINEASTKDVTPVNKKLVFGQVISSSINGVIGRHPVLKKEMDDYLSFTYELFQQNHAWWGSNVGRLIGTRQRIIDIINEIEWSAR
ncbi:GapS1 family protein [Pseudomonas syringae]|uniref:GapS1 family protein n=1 Tax=Pseudomonas syringae TaxID=317 RepID=UPI003F82BEA1